MDNPDTKAQQEPAEEPVSDSTTPVEEPTETEEVMEPVEEVTAEPTEEVTETVESPKKGAESRIKELNAAKKQAEGKAKSLEEQLAGLTSRDQTTVGQGQPQYQPQVEPGAEISAEQYKQDLMQTAQGIVDIQIKQNNAVNRINNEAQQVIREYPELDPNNEAFDEELSDSITEATLSYVKTNPYTASPKNFVKKMMQPYKRAVDKEVGKASENIAKQASQAAQRPTSVPKSREKGDSELSISELEEKYGIVY